MRKTGYALDSGNHHLLWRGILAAQSDVWFAAEPESCAHPVAQISAAFYAVRKALMDTRAARGANPAGEGEQSSDNRMVVAERSPSVIITTWVPSFNRYTEMMLLPSRTALSLARRSFVLTKPQLPLKCLRK